MRQRVYSNSVEQYETARGGDALEELLSISKTAAHLGVSQTIVRRLMKRGELTEAKIEQWGKQQRRYFRAGDVEALRQQREQRIKS